MANNALAEAITLSFNDLLADEEPTDTEALAFFELFVSYLKGEKQATDTARTIAIVLLSDIVIVLADGAHVPFVTNNALYHANWLTTLVRYAVASFGLHRCISRRLFRLLSELESLVVDSELDEEFAGMEDQVLAVWDRVIDMLVTDATWADLVADPDDLPDAQHMQHITAFNATCLALDSKQLFLHKHNLCAPNGMNILAALPTELPGTKAGLRKLRTAIYIAYTYIRRAGRSIFASCMAAHGLFDYPGGTSELRCLPNLLQWWLWKSKLGQIAQWGGLDYRMRLRVGLILWMMRQAEVQMGAIPPPSARWRYTKIGLLPTCGSVADE